MLYAIRKHPIAFVHALSWIGLGACMAYVMYAESAGGYAQTLYADACVMLAVVCMALIPLTVLVGILLKLVRKRLPSEKREKSFLHMAAKHFEHTRPGFWPYFGLGILAAVLPLLALCSVVLVGDQVAAVLLVSIGITIWLCFFVSAWPESRLLKVRDTADRFRISTESSPSLWDELLRQGDVHGIPEALWQGRRDHLYNMLLRAGAIDERSTVAGHRFSPAAAAWHIGVEPGKVKDEPVVWIPLRAQLSTTDAKSSAVIRELFVYSLDRIADLRYESTADMMPEDYPHSSRELRLVPDEDAFLRKCRSGLRLVAPTAGEAEGDTLHLGCMLQLEGARVVAVKWDQFEDLSPEADRECFLSPEEAQTLFRLLMEDACGYLIHDLTYLEDRKQIALEVWTETEENSGKPVANEAKPFVMDDGLDYLLLIAYDSLKWHWLAERQRTY